MQEQITLATKAQFLKIVLNEAETTMDFCQLLERLLPTTMKYKGAPVPIPEIIIFNEGKPLYFLYYDKKGAEIKKVDDKSKMNLPYLMRFMICRYQNRRIGRDVIKPKVNTHSSIKEFEEDRIKPDRHSQHAEATMVNIKYVQNDECGFLSQAEFLEMMMKRPGSEIWQNISYIQNYIVTSSLMPEIFLHSYIAPLNPNYPTFKIRYSLPKTIATNNNEKADQICNIIGCYLSQLYGLVLISFII